MGTPADLEEVLDRLYTALSTADMQTWIAMHSDDVVLNVNGSTPVSGRIRGAQNILENLLPLVFSRLQPESAQLGVNWKLMCADERRATVIFEGRSKTLAGQDYNNRYVQILEFNGDEAICEVWEFFDTELAQKLVFTPEQTAPVGTTVFEY